MINKLKNSLALFIARKRYFSNNTSQNYKSLVSKASTFLFVLPDNAEDILKSLDIPTFFLLQKKDVVLLAEEKFQKIAQEERKFESILYTEESITKLGLPTKELVIELNKQKFDVVVDLNRNENLFLGILANIPQSGLVIGFKKPIADKLYNLQIANNQNNAEISYRNFLNSIQMF